MSGRLFTPPDDQSLQPRAIVPQMDARGFEAGAGLVATAASRTLLAFSDVMGDLEQRRLRAEEATQEAAARSRMTVSLAELRRSVATGDPTTLRDRWRESVTALRASIREGTPERHRARIDRLTQQMADGETTAILDLQAARTGEVGRATMLRSMDDLVNVAAADPAARERIAGEINALVRTAVDGGLVGAEAGERLRQTYQQRLDRETARAMVRSRRGAGPRVVDDLPLPPIPPADLAMLRNEAAQDFAAAAQEAEADEVAFVASRQALADETFSRALAGGDDVPTVEDVEALRFDLPPGRYRAALAIASGKVQTRDDPSSVGLAVLNLDSDDLEDQLDGALARGDITPATRTRLIAEGQALRSDPVLRRRRAEAQTAIERMIPRCDTDADCEEMWGPQGVSDIAGDVLDEWSAWARANPEARLQEVEEARAVFAQRARDRVVRRVMGRLTPLPGIKAGSTPPYGVAEIEAFESDTLAALDAGEMDSSEAGWRLSLANQWRAIAPDADTDENPMGAGAQRGRR